MPRSPSAGLLSSTGGVSKQRHRFAREHLVAAQVRRADDDGFPPHRAEDLLVGELLFFSGEVLTVEVEEFGAEEPDPGGAHAVDVDQVVGGARCWRPARRRCRPS